MRTAHKAAALGALALALAAPGPARASSPRAVLLDVFGPRLGPCFVAIATRESRLDPSATNWTDRHSDGSRGSFGLLQIGAVHRARGETVAAFRARMLDPRANALEGRRLYGLAGLAPWGGHCA